MNDSMHAEDEHDVVIIGGGVAGVSCALECFDIQLATEVFETDARPGGQLAEIPHSVRNLAAGRFENGPALRGALEESAAILGARLRLSQAVTRVELGGRWVEADGRRVHARALVLATGTSRQQLPSAPDGAFGGAVTYQLDAGNRDQFAGREVVVIGGGDSGTLDALELARTGSAVKLVHRGDALTARHDVVEQIRSEPRIDDLAGWELDGLRGGGHLEEVVLRRADGQQLRLAAQGLVVKIARAPRTQLFRGQLELDRAGAIVVDDELRTSSEGVFAAGDVVAGGYARVAAAIGQGSLAARSVLRYLQGKA
jgi:thioredoxin reductase (NADPH)